MTSPSPTRAAPARRRPASTKASAPEPIDDLRREAWEPMMRLLMAERLRWASFWQGFDLTPVQGMALMTLVRREPGPMSGLASALACDPSNITGIVDKLEA